LSSVRYRGLFAVSVLLLLICPALAAADGRIPVLKRDPSGNLIVIGRSEIPGREHYSKRRRFDFDMPSGRGGSTDRRPLLGAASSVSGTWHVALIRVGFEADRNDRLSSLDLSDGEGGFMLQPDDGWIIDPPPHDRAYFNSHMTCLRNYYQAQSCGRLDITWEIFPHGENDCYKLSDLADYGPGDGMWTTDQLVSFVHDAMMEADPTVNYNNFDAVIIAHAGPNLQSDVNNDTPNDLPSFFARLGDEDRFITDDGKVITDCSVIPETGIQDDYYSGIAAVLAHEFGHQLGLPDLYNIVSGGTGIGIWGNMGSGGQLGVGLGGRRVDGILPAGLSAWSRYYLGWASVDTVATFREAIHLSAVEKVPAEIIRVDISNDEYFLIENRCIEIDGYLTLLLGDPETGVVTGVYNCMNCPQDVDTIPADAEFELSTEYDYLLPVDPQLPDNPFRIEPDFGPGLLIWHIDERLIAARWEANEVNSRNPYAVRLMEAGGVLDIGDPTSPLSYGNYDDAYYDGNSRLFSDVTIPGSWSNMGVPSGITIENISSRDTMMSFDGGKKMIKASAGISADSLPPVDCMLPLGMRPAVLVLDGEGNGWLDDMNTPAFSIGSSPVLPPALAPGFSSGEDAVIAADRDGYIHALTVSGWSEAGGGWPVNTGKLSTYPVVIETGEGMSVAAADRRGRIFILNSAGEEEYLLELPSGHVNISNIAAAVDSDGVTDRLIFLSGAESSTYLWWWNFSMDEYERVPLAFSENGTAGEAVLSAGDILPENPGIEVYVTMSRTGKVSLCSVQDGIIFVRELEGNLQPPAVVDINGDAALDIVVTDGDNIYAISPSGANLTGWPRPINGIHNFKRRERIVTPPAVVGSGNGAVVIAVSENGILFTLDYQGEPVGSAYPEKIAGTIRQPVHFMEMESEGVFSFIDILDNGNGEYFDNRPGRISLKWRTGPFQPEDIATSWYGVGGDLMRRSFASGVGTWNSPARNWTDMDENLIIYPNPVEGGRVGFQFRAPSGSHASLLVFDISGEIVLKKEKVCEGGEEHEIPVTMDETGAGVYIARLVIFSGDRSYRTLKKFAVIN